MFALVGLERAECGNVATQSGRQLGGQRARIAGVCRIPWVIVVPVEPKAGCHLEEGFRGGFRVVTTASWSLSIQRIRNRVFKAGNIVLDDRLVEYERPVLEAKRAGTGEIPVVFEATDAESKINVVTVVRLEEFNQAIHVITVLLEHRGRKD